MCVWSLGRSRDLHSEPRAVLQEVLRFHHHYPVIVSKSGGEGAQKHVGNGEQVGEKWRSRKPKRPEVPWWFWYLCPSLLFLPPHSSVSPCTSGTPHCSYKKEKEKKHRPFTFNLSLFRVLLWRIRVSNLSESLCFILNLFCLYGC